MIGHIASFYRDVSAHSQWLESTLEVSLRLVAVLCCLSLCSCRSASFDATPACSKPAPLIGHYDHRASGYAIGLNDPEKFWPTLSRWEGLYHMHVSNPWREANMVQATLSPEEVAHLRCDPEVKWIEHNGVASISAVAVRPHDL